MTVVVCCRTRARNPHTPPPPPLHGDGFGSPQVDTWLRSSGRNCREGTVLWQAREMRIVTRRWPGLNRASEHFSNKQSLFGAAQWSSEFSSLSAVSPRHRHRIGTNFLLVARWPVERSLRWTKPSEWCRWQLCVSLELMHVTDMWTFPVRRMKTAKSFAD